MNPLLLAVSAGFATSLALIIPLSKLARLIGLVDIPTERKRHIGRVPLVGGLVIVLTLMLWLPLLELSIATGAALLALTGPALLLGVIDDRFGLSARLRFGLQMIIGLVLVYAFDVRLTELDGILTISTIGLSGAVSVAFTAVCITGVLNATNMTDGVDGLLGSVACLSLGVIAVLAFAAGHTAEAGIAMLLVGALVGYLLFNLGVFGTHRKVFLGDSGSLVIGLALVVLLISLSQRENPAFSATAAGWLLGLPLLDTVTVMTRRISEGRSPFSAGRDHFHHQLLDAGLSPRETLFALVAAHAAMLIVGVAIGASAAPPLLFFLELRCADIDALLPDAAHREKVSATAYRSSGYGAEYELTDEDHSFRGIWERPSGVPP